MALKKIKFGTLANDVAHEIRKEIIKGKIKPGQRILENDISKIMGISRSTLREAIHQLKSEGVLKVIPYKGTYVNMFNQSDIEQVYEMRVLLETYALEKIINKRGNGKTFNDIIEMLDKNINEMKIAVKKKDLNSFINSDLNFHYNLINNSSNKFLIQTWKSFITQIKVLLNVEAREYEQFIVSPEEHGELLCLIKSGKIEESKNNLKKHIEKSLSILLKSQSNK